MVYDIHGFVNMARNQLKYYWKQILDGVQNSQMCDFPGSSFKCHYIMMSLHVQILIPDFLVVLHYKNLVSDIFHLYMDLKVHTHLNIKIIFYYNNK